jgi:3-oxoacyl-[acyl-carrier-protein] synthase-3
MDGSEIFSFALSSLPSLIQNTLAKNNIKKDDIGLFIFHQANKYMLDILQKHLKISEDKFYMCLSQVGNTVSGTIPIALCEALRDGNLQTQKKHSTGRVRYRTFVGWLRPPWGGCVLTFNQGTSNP